MKELTLTLDNVTYAFPVVPGESGKLCSIKTRDWEPSDGQIYWRVALHPWGAGLSRNRISPTIGLDGRLRSGQGLTYAKANADASHPEFLTAPPKYRDLGTDISVTYFNTAAQLAFGGNYFGGNVFMGAAASASNITKAFRNFNGKAYFAGGQYLYSVDASLNFNTVNDFGAGKTIYDIEVFNNELVIAMGESEKLWTMSTSETFTQASDNTFAIGLGRVGDKLWRAHDVNQVSNCITAPRTLSSWVPADPNEYTVGDTTWSITDILDVGGAPAVIKPDGVYFPDDQSEFHNQTPQLADYPHPDNGKGAFMAWGVLLVPSASGLLQVTYGNSTPVGPELSGRPDFRFWVRAGVEWNGAVYLVCEDAATSSPTFICKMLPYPGVRGPYTYHEWLRFSEVEENHVILVYTTPENPVMLTANGNGLHYWKMGRGSGPDIDDSNYEFSTVYELETGEFVASEDRAVVANLVGVKIVAKQPAQGTIQISFDLDRSNQWTPMYTGQHNSGVAAIADSGVFSKTVYAPPNTKGHLPNIKINGTLPNSTFGTNRAEIYEVWAFGSAHPESIELIELGILNDRGARVSGSRQPRNTNTLDLLYQLKDYTFEAKVPGYSERTPVYLRIVGIEDTNLEMLREGDNDIPVSVTKVTFARVIFEDIDGRQQ